MAKVDKTAYEKLIDDNLPKGEFNDAAKQDEKEHSAPHPEVKKIQPIVQVASPKTRPIQRQEIQGSTDTLIIRNMKTGMQSPMATKSAENLARRYPNEFKIIN